MRANKIITANNVLKMPFKPTISRGGASSSKMLDDYFENIKEDISNLYFESNSQYDEALQAISTTELQMFTLGHLVDSLRSYVNGVSGSNELYIDMYQPDYIEGASVGGGDFKYEYGQLTQYSTSTDILDSYLYSQSSTDYSGLTIGLIDGEDYTASYYQESASGITNPSISSTWNSSAVATGWISLTVPRLYEHQESNSVIFHPYPLYGLDLHAVKVLIDGTLVDVDISHLPGYNGRSAECIGPVRLWHDTGIVTKVLIEVSPSHFLENNLPNTMGLSYIALKEYSFEEGYINIDLLDYMSLRSYSSIGSVELKGWRETELAALNISISSPFVTIATPSTKPVVITGLKFGLV